MLPEDLPLPLVWAASLAFGLVLGSFANVCIHRLPRDTSIVTPGSRCPACDLPIPARHNIPVLSYLWLRGRCAACGAPIAQRYPLVEAANGLLYVGLVAHFGPSPHTLVHMVFVTALLVLALVDVEHFLLPDAVTLPGIGLGLAVTFLPGWPVRWPQALAAAVGGYAVFWLVAATWRRWRGIEALGQGDWKMAAMLGAFFGWQKLVLAVFVASLGGTVVGLAAMAWHGHDSRHRVPFGTFLAAGALVTLFAGDALLDWYGALWRF